MAAPNPIQNPAAQAGAPAAAALLANPGLANPGLANPGMNAHPQALPANHLHAPQNPLNAHQAIPLAAGQPPEQGDGWMNWGARQAAGFARGLWAGTKLTGQFANKWVVTPVVQTYVNGKLQEHCESLRNLTNSAHPLTPEQLSSLLEPASRMITKLVQANLPGTEAIGEPVHLLVQVNLSKALVTMAHRQLPAGAPKPTPQELVTRMIATLLRSGLSEIEPIRQELQNIEGRAILPEEKKAARVLVFQQRVLRMFAQLLPNGKDDLIFPEIPKIDAVKRALFYVIGTVLPTKIAGECEKYWATVHLPTAENQARVRVLSSDGDAVASALKSLAPQMESIARRNIRDPKRHAQLIAKLIEKFPALRMHAPLLQSSLADLTQNNRIPVEIMTSQAPKLAYPFLLYVFTHLLESGERGDGEHKPAALASIVNSLLASIFHFSQTQRQLLAQHYPAHQAAMAAVPPLPANATPEQVADREKRLDDARRPFEAFFEPLVNEGLQKAGLSLDNMKRLLSSGADTVADSIHDTLNKYACKLCVDFYEECVARPSRPQNEEGRNLLTGLVQEMMPAIRESLAKDDNRREIQRALSEAINSKLENAKLPLAKDWIAQPIKDLLVSSAHYPKLQATVEPLLADSIGDVVASLASNGANQGRADLKAGLQNLLRILVSRLGNAVSVDHLKAWVRMPEGTPQQKEEKNRAHEALFGPCAQEVLERAGWDRQENIRVPKAFQGYLKNAMRNDILPYILCRISCELLVPKELAPFDQTRLERMGGLQELRILCAGLAEMGTPKLLDLIQSEAGLIAGKINEKLAQNRLNNREEAWLGGILKDIFTRRPATPQNPAGPFDSLWPFAENYVSECLKYGLSHLALNYRGRNQGEIGNNIALYLRDLIKSVVVDARLAEMIRNYRRDAMRLRALDRDVAVWRNRAIQEGQAVTQQTLDQLQRAKHARANAQFDQAMHQALLREFEPKIRQLLTDMGFPTANDLPVPFFLKETLWKHLSTHLLPDLCLNAAEKVISSFDELLPSADNINENAQALHYLYIGNGPKPQGQPTPNFSGEQLRNGSQGPLVAGIYKLAETIVKQVESKMALQGAQEARKAIEEKLIPKFYGGDKARVAALQVFDAHRGELERWMEEESPQIAAMIKERLGKSLRDAIAEPLLKGARQFIENIKKTEDTNPESLFDLVSAIVPLVSDHLSVAKNIAKAQGKKYIHEVDPLVMLREFENAKQLHPAMPGYREMKDLQEQERYVKQLEIQAEKYQHGKNAKWHENIDRWKVSRGKWLKPHGDMAPGYYLKDAKENLDRMREQIDTKMKANFYDKFSTYLRHMAGMEKVESIIPRGDEIWKLFGMTKADGQNKFNHQFSQLLLEGMRSAFAPQQLNSYLASLLKTLNENLKVKRQHAEVKPANQQRGPLDPKVKAMEEKCQRLIRQLYGILPGSMVQELTEIPLIDEMPGRVLADALHDALRQNPLSKILQEGLVHAVESLPEKVAMNRDELKHAKKRQEAENARNLDSIREEGEKFLPRLFERLERNLLAWWDKIHARINNLIAQSPAGTRGLKVKEFFDRIFRLVFVSCVIGPVYTAARWVVKHFIVFWSRRVSRDVELGRQSIVETEINANLLYKMGEELKKFYPVPQRA